MSRRRKREHKLRNVPKPRTDNNGGKVRDSILLEMPNAVETIFKAIKAHHDDGTHSTMVERIDPMERMLLVKTQVTAQDKGRIGTGATEVIAPLPMLATTELWEYPPERVMLTSRRRTAN